jgi:uncharacterized protein YxjI
MVPVHTLSLAPYRTLVISQRIELGEFFGFETRNKYQILDETKQPVAFAAEQQKGIFGFLLRQVIGHWRPFTLSFFTPDRQAFMTAHHPFRFFFQRLEVVDAQGLNLGAIQQRFAIFTKRFDVENERGTVVMTVSSPIWKIWTFPFLRDGKQVAAIKKKWSGALSEIFTDKDNFIVEFESPLLTENERRLILAAALFVDLQYFENKAG